MDLTGLKKEFFKRGYDVEICRSWFYLRKHGTIMEVVEDEDLMNFEQLSEKLVNMIEMEKE